MSISENFFVNILKEGLGKLEIDLSKCGGCEDCVGVCDVNAIKKNSEGLYIDNNVCNMCGKCVEVCEKKGKAITRS